VTASTINDISILNPRMMSSPLPPVDDNGPRGRRPVVVVTRTLGLGGAALPVVQVSSLRAAAALHGGATRPTAGVSAGQRAAGVVAGSHVVGELEVLLTRHSWDTTATSFELIV